MSIINCPHCNHHPLSDLAEACPICGGSILPQKMPQGQSESLFKQREDLLSQAAAGLNGGFPLLMNKDIDFPDSAVDVVEISALPILIDLAAKWIEKLDFLVNVTSISDFRSIRKMPLLKSLRFVTTVRLCDERLLQLGKMPNLCELRFTHATGTTSLRGWMQLARLQVLEFVQLPVFERMTIAEEKEIRQALERALPNTLIK